MTLDGGEFIRRFLIHVLPDGVHRIRYYGFLDNCHRARKLAQCRALLGMIPPVHADQSSSDPDRLTALRQALRQCPHCHTGFMVVIDSIPQFRICQSDLDTS